MRAIFGLATLVVIGVIVADLVTHPTALKVGGNALNQLSVTALTSILGNAPTYTAQK